MALELESLLDRLYQAPLTEFVSVRNEAAKQLKAEGRQDEAAALKSLRKPSVAAWTVNQLTFTAADSVEALVQATEELAEAHGRSDADLPGAIRARREHLDHLSELAKEVWAAHGIRSTKDQLRRFTGTLEAATQPDADPRPGRLEQDLEPAGFGALSGLHLAIPHPPRTVSGGASVDGASGLSEIGSPSRTEASRSEKSRTTGRAKTPKSRSKPRPEPPTRSQDAAAEEAARIRAAAQQAMEAANSRLERMERVVARAEADAGAAGRRVQRARAKLSEIETRLEQARKDVDEATTRADAKDKELQELLADRDTARARAETARNELDALNVTAPPGAC